MSFQLPTTFTPRNTPTGELSPNSKKLYTRRLNALAESGFDTVALLTSKKLQVIRAIKTLIPGDSDNDRMVKRQFISAIMWVLPSSVTTKKNAYHSYYQMILPNVAGWKKRSEHITE